MVSWSSDAVVALQQGYFVPFCRWKNMCFPTANRAVNSCRCLNESCSLVYSPGKLLALFFVETWPDCKEFVVQNGLNVYDISSTSLFRIQLKLVDLDPNQVSSQLVNNCA